VIFIEQNFGPHIEQKCADFCAFGGERLVVILLGRVGIERQVELVAPAEFEPRADSAHRRGPWRCGMALGQVGGVGGDFCR
jgi:hypothetical protein